MAGRDAQWIVSYNIYGVFSTIPIVDTVLHQLTPITNNRSIMELNQRFNNVIEAMNKL